MDEGISNYTRSIDYVKVALSIRIPDLLVPRIRTPDIRRIIDREYVAYLRFFTLWHLRIVPCSMSEVGYRIIAAVDSEVDDNWPLGEL